MARYKVKRRKGLGYVYYTPDGRGSMQKMSDIYGKYLTPELLASDPAKYAGYLKKRDDGIIRLLDIWKIPYTRDDSFGSATVGQNLSTTDVPLSQTVILDENNNEVPIQTVLADPNATVTITDEVANEVSPATPQTQTAEKDNTMLYVGAGILAVGAYMLMGGKKKKQPAMGATAPRKRRKAVRKKK